MEVLTGVLLFISYVLIFTLLFTVIDLDFFIGWMHAIVYFRQRWRKEQIVFEFRNLSRRDRKINPRTMKDEPAKTNSIDTSNQD